MQALKVKTECTGGKAVCADGKRGRGTAKPWKPRAKMGVWRGREAEFSR